MTADTKIEWTDATRYLPSVLMAPSQPSIDWVIVGGESGGGARPMHPDWARSLRDQCVEAEVPFLFKQWGNWAPHPLGHSPANVGKKAAGRQLDGRTWDEYPAKDRSTRNA